MGWPAGLCRGRVQGPWFPEYFRFMTENKTPQRPDRGRVSGADVAEALADVLKDQNQKAKDRLDASPRGKKKASPGTWAAFVLAMGLSGYVWIGSPSWLDTAPSALPPALVEAGLRMEVFQHAVLIEEFREAEDRLPNDLSEAADASSEVEYDQIDAQNYRLTLASQDRTVEYVSTGSLEAFLGNSLQVIRHGG